ncbi:YqhV family protein [Caldalkalibacillus thermarum TA2.A1]|uniref:YqhV family protein n=1 Tax=Caldalkalibacillus thermarum (strain TA2.A1) TaxID=986075 RepID=A0A8X8L8Z4_CALTT|nr:YqhV family protein [Caldalkalibacillus thermarum]QZT32643.1 YqhV family protein [Caldalkalibacillus thermarum TA2.A1]GGK18992.1 hypothetical protein GCM10010965_10020 [Caldalkalibacillus thermarum]
MIYIIDKVIVAMASLRLVSGLIEMVAGFLILKLNSVEKAMMVNAFLAMVGPLFFITSMTLGLVHLAGKMPYSKLVLIGTGVGLIILGLRK